MEWLEEHRRSDPRLVVLDLANRGAGATRQAGIEAATGEVVLLLDDDVIARPGLVAGHLSHHLQLEPKLVLGYMPAEYASQNSLEIEAFGRRSLAIRLERCAYDPGGERVRA